jgi:hypothetical protein
MLTRLSVVAACLALCGLALSGGASASARADATLAVTYIGSTSLQVKLDDGTTVRSGSVIPAGSYLILVDDPDDTAPKFVMSGPGVNISSDLNSTGMGIDRPASFGPDTLQASSSYTLSDVNIGGSAITFSTSSSATATGGSGGSSTSGGGSSSTGSGSSSSGSGRSSSSGTKSTTSTLVGTLAAAVSASGQPTLKFGGKAVKTLKPGRYKLTIADHSKKAGFIVWKLGSHAMMLSGVAAAKSSSQTLTLIAGKWFFEASMSGPKTYFTVT